MARLKIGVVAAIAIGVVVAPLFLSAFILRKTADLHGVTVTSGQSSWKFEDLNSALTFAASHDVITNARIAAYVMLSENPKRLFVLRGVGKCKFFIDRHMVMNKITLTRTAQVVSISSGLHELSFAYRRNEKSGPLELFESTNFVTAHVFDRHKCYLDSVNEQTIRGEKNGILLRQIGRFNALIIPLLLIAISALPLNKIRTHLSERRNMVVLLILVSLAALRFYGFSYQMPEGVHPDERMIEGMVRDVHTYGLDPQQFWYTTGFIYVTAALGELFRWVMGYGPMEHSMQRLVSCLASAFSCLFVYLIALRLFNRQIATISMVVFGMLFMPVYLAHFGIIEPFMVLLFLAAFYTTLQVHDSPSFLSFAKAGLLAGLAVATKQTAALIVVPFVIVWIHLAATKKIQQNGIKQLAVYGVAFAAGIFILAPYAILDFSRFMEFQSRQMENLSGLSRKRLYFAGNESFASFGILLDNVLDGVGFPILLASIVGLFLAFKKAKFAGVLIGSVVLAYIIVSGSIATMPYHYALLLCPFIAILASFAISFMSRWKFFSGWRIVLPMFLLLAIPAYHIFSLERALSGIDTRRQAEDWCYHNLPGSSRIDFETFGPRFLIPSFESLAVPMFTRQRWQRHIHFRNPQYYIEDSITSETFLNGGPEKFPRQNEWLKWIHQNGVKVAQFNSISLGILNPTITVYRIPLKKSSRVEERNKNLASIP